METTISTYEQQAIDFLEATDAIFKATFLKNGKHWEDDKEDRDIYEITLQRRQRKYTFNFGQSIAHSGEWPTAYDVLACIQKYEVGTFENFCSEFGYDEDSRKAEKIYNAVKDEYQNIAMLWNENELEQLREIQ